MTAPKTVHLSKSVSGALVDFGDVAGSYEYVLKSTADARVAAAYEAASVAGYKAAMAHEGVRRWTLDDLAQQVSDKIRALTPTADKEPKT